jgi:FeS assembly SUF system protein
MNQSSVEEKTIMQLKGEIIEALQNIFDPEIPVSIYELGLIYNIEVSPDKTAKIEFTLTTPNCPVAESLPKDVEDKVAAIEGISKVDLNLTFDPPWTMDMMSEAAKLQLGFF